MATVLIDSDVLDAFLDNLIYAQFNLCFDQKDYDRFDGLTTWLRKEIKASKQKSFDFIEWRPITEMPEPDEDILVKTKYGNICADTFIGYRDNDSIVWELEKGCGDVVEMWAHLPGHDAHD